MRSDEKEIPSSSGSFLAGAMDYTSSNKTERKEHKGILATCGIWRGVPQQNGKFIGTGSLIKDFFPNCDKKTHLVTSDKVISPDALRFYSLYFKKSKDKEEEPKKLVDMVSDEVIFKSGLAIVPVDPNKLNFKRKRHPPSTICAKVRKDLRNDELYCHVLESFGGPFTITPYQVKGIADKETYIADDISGKMESSRFYKDHRKGLGAPITITVNEEAVVVGAITLDNNNQISFVLFSEIDRTRISSG